MKFVSSIISLSLCLAACATAVQRPIDELPKVKLPYGTWQAGAYDKANDVGY
jgi:hypothetical protein